jgi:hypothetical protein
MLTEHGFRRLRFRKKFPASNLGNHVLIAPARGTIGLGGTPQAGDPEGQSRKAISREFWKPEVPARWRLLQYHPAERQERLGCTRDVVAKILRLGRQETQPIGCGSRIRLTDTCS